MPKKNFTVIIEGKQHCVQVKTRRLIWSGELLVDGRVVNAWGARLLGPPPEIRFEVAGKPAIVTFTAGLRPFNLYVDGKKI